MHNTIFVFDLKRIPIWRNKDIKNTISNYNYKCSIIIIIKIYIILYYVLYYFDNPNICNILDSKLILICS